MLQSYTLNAWNDESEVNLTRTDYITTILPGTQIESILILG